MYVCMCVCVCGLEHEYECVYVVAGCSERVLHRANPTATASAQHQTRTVDAWVREGMLVSHTGSLRCGDFVLGEGWGCSPRNNVTPS